MDPVVVPFDVAEASDGDLADYHDLTVAAFAVDRPDAPPLSYDATIARLRTPFTHFLEQRIWSARCAGHIVGIAVVQAPEGDNEHVAVIDVRVHPRARRQGIGSALLGAVLPDLRIAGRRRVVGEGLTVGGAGPEWARALGFVEVNEYVLQTLRVAEVNPDLWEVPIPVGYEFRRWVGGAPAELLVSYARARSAMADAPAGDSTVHLPSWTPDNVRAAEAVVRARGVERRVVAAVHAGEGAVVGLTEVEVYPTQPDQVVQQDTAVLHEHRGHGLGRSLKCAMMRWLTAEHPGFDRVVTSTAASNAHMIRVNEQVGYVTTRVMVDVEAGVEELAGRLIAPRQGGAAGR
jgi:GNAT superfamily N-acetyltransferase